MNLDTRFGLLFLSLIFLPIASSAVPLHPQTAADLRASGRWQQTMDIYRQARTRGLDQPTPFPINVREMAQTDQVYLNVLTILVDFSDNPADTVNYPLTHYEELLYSQGTFPTGSLRDYYLENSYGEVHIVGEVSGWYRMPHTYAYYVDGQYGFGNYPQNAQKLTEDAVAAADSYVDFSQYDNDGDGYVDALFVVHAGPGAEVTGNVNDIWSHAWVTNNVPFVDGVYVYSYSQEPEDGHIGVFGHELGHALFGLPDLYDYGYDSQGTGYWSMMSVGTWGGGGVTPVHFDAWSKVTAGFVAATNVVEDQSGVAIPQVETNNIIYRLWTLGAPGPQYFLVENRQEVGFDVSLPSNGLLIYHIEEAEGSNNNQWYPGYTSNGHYIVAVEQADGNWDLEQNNNSGDAGDPWPGSSGATVFDENSTPDSKDYDFQPTLVTVSNISTSADTMYADFEVGNPPPPPAGLEINLTPLNPPIIIPVTGGSFSYDAELINHDSTAAQTQFWVMVLLPGGSYFGPILGPLELSIAGYDTLQATLTQNVPDRAPSGDYSLIGYIGNYPSTVEDSSYFDFSKVDQAAGVEPTGTNLPLEYAVLPCHPNPFNPSTTLTYTLPVAGPVALKVYDAQGREVANLLNRWQAAGTHEITFDAGDLAAGVYFYRFTAGQFSAAGKMVLMK